MRHKMIASWPGKDPLVSGLTFTSIGLPFGLNFLEAVFWV